MRTRSTGNPYQRSSVCCIAGLLFVLVLQSSSRARAASIASTVEVVQALEDGRIWVRLSENPTCTGTQVLKLAANHPNFAQIFSLFTAALLSGRSVLVNHDDACGVVNVSLRK